jgi:hypothetical protein
MKLKREVCTKLDKEKNRQRGESAEEDGCRKKNIP